MSLGIERFARRPVAAAARSGRGVLTSELDRALKHLLATPFPERVVDAVIDERVLARITAQAAKRTADDEELLERVVAAVIADERVGRAAALAAEEVVASAGFERALRAALASPEVRVALQQQASGFGAELAAAFRARTARLDDALDARVRRVLHRKPAAPGLPGVAVRGVALVLDAAIALVAFGLAAGSITLIASLAGLGAGSVAAVAAGAGWLLTVAVYFGGFWATTGQTPGMRMARIRVVAADGAPPGPLRALVRVAGLLLSIGMLFVGFAPALVDTRRRALPDFLAGTVVVDQDDALAANHPHGVMSREASPGMVSQ